MYDFWQYFTKNVLNNILQHCDFQKYRNIIIPPACVQLEKGRVSNIKHPGDTDWEPFIILGMFPFWMKTLFSLQVNSLPELDPMASTTYSFWFACKHVKNLRLP